LHNPLRLSGGDKELGKALIWNGPVDAWRHAEWNRRMASDPQVGPTFAAIVGVGHEVQNLYEKVTGQGTPGQTWKQFAQESLMDLSNNRFGRTQAELGASVISHNDPGLVYGAGGRQGQPNLSLSDYINGTNNSYFVNDAAAGGFLLYPSKSNLNAMQSVYSKDHRK
jgi:hypothetical protein